MEALETSKDFLGQFTNLQIGVAATALVFLIFGLRLIFKKPPTHLTAFSGEAGSVQVSRKALQDLVKAACLLNEPVEAARPVIQVKNNKITARIELRLATPQELKAVCETVQQQITSLLQKSLSFDQIGEIQIVVKSFSSETGEQTSSKKGQPTESALLESGSPATKSKEPNIAPQDDDQSADKKAE